MKNIFLGCGLLLYLVSNDACADWAQVGAAYTCTGETLSVEATIKSSGGSIDGKSGSIEVRKGRNVITCSIKGTRVEAVLFFTPPATRGECGSAGTITLESIRIDKKEVLGESGYLNNYCTMQPSYINFEITKHEAVVKLKLCRGRWNWGIEFENVSCDETTFH